MKTLFKKTIVILTSVLMAASMVVSASAASSEWGTYCTGNSSSSNNYSVYTNVDGSGCLSGLDLNSLLSGLGSYGCLPQSESAADCNSSDVAGTSENCTPADSASQSDSPASVPSCDTADTSANSIAAAPSCGATDTSENSEAAAAVQAELASVSNNACISTQLGILSDKCTSTDCSVQNGNLSSIISRFRLSLNNLGIYLADSSEAATSQTPQSTDGNDTTAVNTDNSTAETVANENVESLSFEEQVVALVNEQRAENGLAPLTLSTELSNAARAKSQDMHDNNYFSHTSPTYGSPFDMLHSFGISYSAAGENIAMGYATPEAVMNAWMNSSGHRANILNASYTQIGVGYVSDGNYWTQEFIG